MAILANQKILTLDYWKTAHDLKTGDIVFDRHGNPRTVRLVQEYRAPVCYAIKFDDQLEMFGDKNLSFFLESPGYRIGFSRYRGLKKFRKKLDFKTVEELMDTDVLYSVPTTDPINLPHQDLPVPPFLFGFWFFGRKKTRRLPQKMSAPRGFSEMVHEKFRDSGYKIREHDLIRTGERFFSILPTIESQLIGTPTHKIPNNYLLASVEQRIELLQGILHAKENQYSKQKKVFRFTSKNRNISLQVQGLLESLGHCIKVYYDPWKKYYRITFRSRLKLMDEQILKSKVMVHNGRRFVKSVKKLPAQLCVHIETDGPDNSVLVGAGFIPCL